MSRSSLHRANVTERRAPVWDEAHARMIAGLPPKRSPIVTIALAAGFLAASWVAYDRGEVIREQTETLAALDSVLVQYEQGAESLVKNYESASLRASMALAAYDRCRWLRGVASP